MKQELFQEKLSKVLKIYAWSTKEIPKFKNCLKVGQTTDDVNQRIKKSQGVSRVSYHLEVEEEASDYRGEPFTDHQVRSRLISKGFENPELEWMRCTAEDVLLAIKELREGKEYHGSHTESFKMREEQEKAVKKTSEYYKSIWKESGNKTPRFLWNAKMRFGKTFTTYQLAKKIEAQRILVVTFKPAVEDAWMTDLQNHIDFKDWKYFSNNSEYQNPESNDNKSPFVYFGSFQDLLGKDKKTGSIKSKNEWLHKTKWDLVVFDEYHFGAWRDNAKELFEGEDLAVVKKELKNEYADDLDYFDEALVEFNESEEDFLPISTRAYLYLSGTPFKAIANGEFIEEQIFNWTYTDEQQAKNNFSINNPNEENPYASLPEMRLFTYQMPDEIISIANKGEFSEFDLNSFFEASGQGGDAKFKNKDKLFFINKYYKPELPLNLTKYLLKFANSSIDVSDGLIDDLSKMINRQSLSFHLFENKIPVSNKLSNLIKKQRLNKINLISNGDDYQVLFTADIKKARIIKKASKTTGIKITKIGKIISGKGKSLIFDAKGKQIQAKSKGYIHQF